MKTGDWCDNRKQPCTHDPLTTTSNRERFLQDFHEILKRFDVRKFSGRTLPSPHRKLKKCNLQILDRK